MKQSFCNGWIVPSHLRTWPLWYLCQGIYKIVDPFNYVIGRKLIVWIQTYLVEMGKPPFLNSRLKYGDILLATVIYIFLQIRMIVLPFQIWYIWCERLIPIRNLNCNILKWIILFFQLIFIKMLHFISVLVLVS